VDVRIIVSRPLIRFFRHAEVDNEALSDESVTSKPDGLFPESDHATVVGEFELS
jgi:hypothetical protein